MRNRRAVLAVMFVLFVFAFAASVRAQGVIVPRPCERCPERRPVPNLPRALPVRSIKIETRIVGQVATTHIEQVFRNDTDAVLEGTYFFPIPESASISEFAIWENGQRLVGEVRSREEARRIYDEIVRRQRDPGLLEYAGTNLFQASIFPIPARSDKKLELTYTQVLTAESGTVAYRYPLGVGRNLTTVGSVTGRVEIENREPLRTIYSPSHNIATTRSNGDQRASVTFETGASSAPQDFQLFYSLSREDFGVSLITHREPGRDGYFLMMISPRNDWAETELAAKDIVFVLDTSGSMAEEGKMEKARAALLFGIRNLRAGDRFNVVSFAGEERLMENGLIAADERGRARGEEFVRNLRPVGGTNINAAALAAIRQFSTVNAERDRPRMLIFLTDGLPTVGETNVNTILENVRTARERSIRLFTFGVGYDVNTTLLDRMASENNGVADYVEPREDIEVKVSNFFAKVNSPVLTDLSLDMGGVETDLIYPRQMPDLFRGTQIALIGRYRNPRDMERVRVRLTGQANRQTRTFTYESLRFPLVEDANDFLPRLWATRRVGWLMEQIRSNGEQRELRDEVVDLGTRYGIVTPYTSYLAIESREQVTVVGGANVTSANSNMTAPTTGRQVQSLPRNGRGTVANRRAIPSAPPPTASTGPMAVQQSQQARAQQEAVRVESDARSDEAVVRRIGSKTFYLRDGVWTDAEFRAEARLPETTLSFGSDEYFALLRRERRLVEFFALGERVVVVFNSRVYRVNSGSN
jgi:Ca-activated chloride channel homolog